MADIAILYGIVALILIGLAVIFVVLWLQWRHRHTIQSKEVRIVFPDGTIRRTVVTRANVWPIFGNKAVSEDKYVLTEADHVEIILRGEENKVREKNVRKAPTLTHDITIATSEDL